MASRPTHRILSELKLKDENNVIYSSSSINIIPYVNLIAPHNFTEVFRMWYT